MRWPVGALGCVYSAKAVALVQAQQRLHQIHARQESTARRGKGLSRHALRVATRSSAVTSSQRFTRSTGKPAYLVEMAASLSQRVKGEMS